MSSRQKIIVGLLILMVIAIGGIIFVTNSEPEKPVITKIQGSPTGKVETKIEATMKLASSAFEKGQMIPDKYTCDGVNVNPPLSISDISSNTASLVLIMDDPDAPAGTWVHWVVANIDPKAAEIVENSVPMGAIEAITSFGKVGYGGPCPPQGTHRYFFKLYALDVKLDLPRSSTLADVEGAMTGHILGQSELVGLYKRQ